MAVPRELLLGLMPIRFASLVLPLASENCSTPHLIVHQKIEVAVAVVFKTESFVNLIYPCLFICLYRFMRKEKYNFLVHAPHFANMNDIVVLLIDQDRRSYFADEAMFDCNQHVFVFK